MAREKTYEIKPYETVNDKLDKWEERGYERMDAEKLQENIGVWGTGRYSREEIMGMDPGRSLLVLVGGKEVREEINRLRRRLTRLNGKIRRKRGQIRETREDLRELRRELEGLRERRERMLERARELRAEGGAYNIQEAQRLQGRALQTWRRMQELKKTIEGTEEDIERYRGELEELKSKRSDLRERIEELREKREVKDIVIVCETEFEAYISGQYEKGGRATRKIGGRGRKVLRVGARAPLEMREGGDEELFWEELYSEVDREIYGENITDGKWFEFLMDKLNELRRGGWREEMTARRNFIGRHWIWRKGTLKNEREFPENGGELLTEIGKRCETMEEV